jgi:hypothetical protein
VRKVKLPLPCEARSAVWRLCLVVTERMSHAWVSSVSTTLTTLLW